PDERHPEDDGAQGSPDTPLPLLARSQVTHGQRDHERVVPSQREVEDDDRHPASPELRVGQLGEVHLTGLRNTRSSLDTTATPGASRATASAASRSSSEDTSPARWTRPSVARTSRSAFRVRESAFSVARTRAVR